MEPDDDLMEFIPAEPVKMSPLTVNIDVMELFERYEEEKAWEILGKLKDLFG